MPQASVTSCPGRWKILPEERKMQAAAVATKDSPVALSLLSSFVPGFQQLLCDSPHPYLAPLKAFIQESDISPFLVSDHLAFWLTVLCR